jgi:hypothetical protein
MLAVDWTVRLSGAGRWAGVLGLAGAALAVYLLNFHYGGRR